MNRNRVMLGLAAVVGLVGAIGLYRAVFHAEQVEVAIVEQGVIEEEVRGPGSVSSRTEVAVSSRIAGVVDRVWVEEGDRVELGQPLATLDDRDLTARANAAQAAADSALHTVTVAVAALDKAAADLTLARSSMTRDEEVFAAGHLPAAVLDATTAGLHVAQSAHKSAVAALAARRDDARRMAEEAELARTQASHATLTSPLAGLVTRRQVEVGSTVAPGSTLFRIVDDKTVCVAVRVDVSRVGRVQLGLAARILLASGDERTGTVARISHESDAVTRDQEVRVLFDEPPAHLTLAEEAQVTIRLGEAAGLVIPAKSILADEGTDVVMVVRQGRAVREPVRIGAIGQGNAQVLEGLAAGDLVLRSPGEVRPGQRVRPLEAN